MIYFRGGGFFSPATAQSSRLFFFFFFFHRPGPLPFIVASCAQHIDNFLGRDLLSLTLTRSLIHSFIASLSFTPNQQFLNSPSSHFGSSRFTLATTRCAAVLHFLIMITMAATTPMLLVATGPSRLAMKDGLSWTRVILRSSSLFPSGPRT